ncbi:MAG: hypothetical protein SGARI_003636 [Bacillariaceae sp.]
MTWHAKGAGNACFLVNAASGIVLYEPETPQDSKVVIADASAKRQLGNAGWASLPSGAALQESVSGIEGEAIAIRESTKAFKKSFMRNKREALALEKAMSVSKMDAEQEQEEEEQSMKRALSLSILDSKQETEIEDKYRMALEESKLEADKQRSEEEDILQVIEISKNEHELDGMTEEQLFQRAMVLSQQEHEKRGDEGATAALLSVMENSRKEGRVADKDDEDLLQILEKSVIDF